MPYKPTIFIVTDIETTYKHRIAFDVAWKAIDRRGNEYCKGSYLITEAFTLDVPYFKEKLGWYFQDTFKHEIKPLPLLEIRNIYNKQLSDLVDAGHRVIFCAYNARFDAQYLGETSWKLLGRPFLDIAIEVMDIWGYWCNSAPRNYNLKTEKGNPRTSAEFVYRFEEQAPEFKERHIAFSDVKIECSLLLKTLARKKKLPVFKHWKNIPGQPWRQLLSYPAYNT